MPDTDYDIEMAHGRTALAARDFRAAYRHFGRAHNLGHDTLAHHLAAHRGLLTTAWRHRRPHRAIAQLTLMAAAAFFDRNRQPTPPDPISHTPPPPHA
ncbi:DUF3703 domain-containing protein [Actinokineospora enzanensis]|uniref:DUF3703 domain-containing protein n=1 Tax=Actinokineospora enzanensis TaxID=155975 RepID=UPI00035EE2A1|nr:DUF3703 domain-containing protein [Actinokineospora enzanensis]